MHHTKTKWYYSLQNNNRLCLVKMVLRDRSVHLPDDASTSMNENTIKGTKKYVFTTRTIWLHLLLFFHYLAQCHISYSRRTCI